MGRYFIYKDCQILGPYAREELGHAGPLRPETLVCEEGVSGREFDWKSAEDLTELSGLYPPPGSVLASAPESLLGSEAGWLERLELESMGVPGFAEERHDWIARLLDDAEIQRLFGRAEPSGEDVKDIGEARERIRALHTQIESLQTRLTDLERRPSGLSEAMRSRPAPQAGAPAGAPPRPALPEAKPPVPETRPALPEAEPAAPEAGTAAPPPPAEPPAPGAPRAFKFGGARSLPVAGEAGPEAAAPAPAPTPTSRFKLKTLRPAGAAPSAPGEPVAPPPGEAPPGSPPAGAAEAPGTPEPHGGKPAGRSFKPPAKTEGGLPQAPTPGPRTLKLTTGRLNVAKREPGSAEAGAVPAAGSVPRLGEAPAEPAASLPVAGSALTPSSAAPVTPPTMPPAATPPSEPPTLPPPAAAPGPTSLFGGEAPPTIAPQPVAAPPTLAFTPPPPGLVAPPLFAPPPVQAAGPETPTAPPPATLAFTAAPAMALGATPMNPSSAPAQPVLQGVPTPGTQEVIARLAKPAPPAAPQPSAKKRGFPLFFVVSAVLLVGIIAAFALFLHNTKDVKTMMAMGEDQKPLGAEVPEEGAAAATGRPPFAPNPNAPQDAAPQAPGGASPATGAAPQAAAPAVAPAPAAEPAPAPDAGAAAMALVKNYPLGGDRASVGQWLQYSFMANPGDGNQEEWTAGAVDATTYLVQYRLMPGPRSSVKEPITYLFEADTSRRTVKGSNPAARELMSGGGVARPAKPKAKRALPRKPRAGRRAAGPDRRGPVPQLPLPSDDDLLPPAEGDAEFRKDTVGGAGGL